MLKENSDAYSLAIAGLVMSLLFFIPFLSLIGLILGIAALFKMSKNKEKKGKGLAISAIVVGAAVLLLQISFVVAVYGFFSVFLGFFKGIDQGENSIQPCLEQEGFAKEMCLILTISVSLDKDASLDVGPQICDNEIKTPDLNYLCNAILKKDKTYCAKIEDGDSRIKCFGLVEELQRKEVVA